MVGLGLAQRVDQLTGTRSERHIKQSQEERGALLAIVEVRVYENDEEPQVSFPQDALLGVETDSSVISDVVARAREQLAHWR